MDVNKIYNMDCIEGLEQLDNQSVDLFFMDPPYNKGKDYGEGIDDSLPEDEYLDWVKDWTELAFKKLKSTGSFYHMNSHDNIYKIKLITDNYGYYKNNIIWLLRAPTPNKMNYPSCHQDILFYTKSEKGYTFNNDIKIPFELRANREFNLDHIPYNVWMDIPQLMGGFMAQPEVFLDKGTFKRKHPMQLPLKLLRRVVSVSSNKGDLVVDPFCGSGVTCIACKILDRNYIGFDLNKEYVELSSSELKKLVKVDKWL